MEETISTTEEVLSDQQFNQEHADRFFIFILFSDICSILRREFGPQDQTVSRKFSMRCFEVFEWGHSSKTIGFAEHEELNSSWR